MHLYTRLVHDYIHIPHIERVESPISEATFGPHNFQRFLDQKIPSGNQTWQWKKTLLILDFASKTPIHRGFPASHV